MIIRNDQFESLSESAETGYVDASVKHLQQFDPLLATAAGRTGLEQVAREGLNKARSYGLGQSPALQLYLQLMMSLGSAFDTDPQFGWLHPFLEPMDGVGTMERARLLHFHAMAYRARAYGEKGEYGEKAIERAGQLTRERLQLAGSDLAGRGPKLLEWLHPERMDYLAPNAIAGLISGAARNAAQAGLPAADGGAFVLLMMSSFGHRVCADPLHPWLAKELADQPGEDSSAKMDRLLSRTKTYLAMMIRQLREGRR